MCTCAALCITQCQKHDYGAHCVRHNARRHTCCDATQQDTSAATLSWALYLLSQPQHAAYRSALKEEVTAVCGSYSSSSSSSDSSSAAAGHVTAAHLGKLRLVDAVIKEVSANHLLLQCADC
jgi:Cytochrome P450